MWWPRTFQNSIMDLFVERYHRNKVLGLDEGVVNIVGQYWARVPDMVEIFITNFAVHSTSIS